MAATINPPFTYQWLRNGTPINGATEATLNLTNVDTANAGEYKVIVTNSDGSTTSQGAVLTESADDIVIENSELRLEIGDDGCGLPPEAARIPEHGLDNMKKRMTNLGGQFSAIRGAAGGTRLTIVLPLGRHTLISSP